MTPTRTNPAQSALKSCNPMFCYSASYRKHGEPGGTRTRDPLIKSQMLCQLSYRPYKAS